MNLSKGFFSILFVIVTIGSNEVFSQNCYSDENVLTSYVSYENDNYFTVTMLRQGNLVKAKYFAAKSQYGKSVYQRFVDWKREHPNVVLLSSGTYWDSYKVPQGLTIDNGTIVNRNLVDDRMDALVVVYPTGGIAVSNLNDGNLKIDDSGIIKTLNLRNSQSDLNEFVRWSVNNQATVFQTHLLLFKDEVMLAANSSMQERERRFLAVGTNRNGQLIHVIIHSPNPRNLKEGTERVYDFLKKTGKMESVIFMINLDTGAQDVFQLFNSDCTINEFLTGRVAPEEAANLLVYYF